MAIVKINAFGGMIPRVPRERLPDSAAAYAKNCYFGNGGELRSIKGPGTKRLVPGGVRALFTDNGWRFYTFPRYTRAYLSPTIDDYWSRVYFNPETGGLRLTSVVAVSGIGGMRGVEDNPGPPELDLKVGVRRPANISATNNQIVEPRVWVVVLHDGAVAKSTLVETQIDEVISWTQYRLTATAGSLHSPASPTPNVESVQFRLKLVNAQNGVVHFEGIVPHVEEGGNTFLLTIPQAVSGNAVTVAYAATLENVTSEESAPVGPALVETRDNGMFAVNVTVTPGARDTEQLLPAYVNLYRTYPGSDAYFFVARQPYSDATPTYTFVDQSVKPESAITLAKNQAEWDEPPAAINNLTYAGNGFFCGSVGKDLYFSEPYRPHAWPYRMIFPSEIKGIIEVEGGVLVTTTTRPYFVYGSHPSAMTQQSMSADQAGASSKSMTRIEGAALYAGYDGIVRATAGQVSIDDSRKLFDRQSWKTIGFQAGLDAACLSAWNGSLVYVHDSDLPSLIFTLDDAPGVVMFDPGQPLKGVGVSAATDTTYLLYSDGFAEHGVGEYLPLDWYSKVFDFPQPVAIGAVIVDGNGSFSFDFFYGGGDVVFHTETVIVLNGEIQFRLPACRSKKWQVRIYGTGVIRRIEFGSSFAELKNG